MSRKKKKPIKRVQLWIELGAFLLLITSCAFNIQQKVFIFPAWRFWHLKATYFEIPAPKYELVVPEHPAIDTWAKWFSGKNHRSFQTQLDRARLYATPAQEIFEREGLPKDLIYVALIESGFLPTARSHASAMGMWQIVPTTGNRFGLLQNNGSMRGAIP